MTYIIEQHGTGYAYKIFNGGTLVVWQKETPGAAGIVPMTEAEAEAFALAEIAAAEQVQPE